MEVTEGSLAKHDPLDDLILSMGKDSQSIDDAMHEKLKGVIKTTKGLLDTEVRNEDFEVSLEKTVDPVQTSSVKFMLG